MNLKAGQVTWGGVNGIVRMFIQHVRMFIQHVRMFILHVPGTLTFRSLANCNKA